MDYFIETDFQGPGFVAVPNHVAQGNLSPEALGVLVWFASLPRGYLLRVSSLRERFNLGKDKWQRIARELRDAGAIQLRQVRGQGGHIVGSQYLVRWPEPVERTESRKTRLSDREPGKPAAGKSANLSRKIRQPRPENPAPLKEKENKKSGPVKKRPALSGAALQSVRLNDWQTACLQAGKSIHFQGEILLPENPLYESLRRHAFSCGSLSDPAFSVGASS